MALPDGLYMPFGAKTQPARHTSAAASNLPECFTSYQTGLLDGEVNMIVAMPNCIANCEMPRDLSGALEWRRAGDCPGKDHSNFSGGPDATILIVQVREVVKVMGEPSFGIPQELQVQPFPF